MNQKSRRRILKGLAITLPVVWTKPVVEFVVLPAHAQTTGPCSAPEGCYDVPTLTLSIDWPGGTGPQTASLFNGSGCTGQSSGDTEFVLARDANEAVALLPCANAVNDVVEFPSPDLPDGCSFWTCD